MQFCKLIVNFSHVFDFSFDIFAFGLYSFTSWKKKKKKIQYKPSLFYFFFFFYILFSLNGSNLSNGIIINDSPKKIESL